MADIFLSYDHEDRSRAASLADALQSCGWSVWWDRRIPTGRDFQTDIQEQLATAQCIVVLWSKHSVASRWVRDEATEGLNRERLVPAVIDTVQPPLGFRQLQTSDIRDWDGRVEHDEYQRLVSSIAALVPPGATAADGVSRASTARSSGVRQGRPADVLDGLPAAPASKLRPRVWPPTRGAYAAASTVLFLLAVLSLRQFGSSLSFGPLGFGVARHAGSAAVTPLSDNERQRIQLDTTQQFVNVVNDTWTSDGHFRISIDDSGADVLDVWTSAQCAAALASASGIPDNVRDRVRRAIRALAANRKEKEDGWRIQDETAVEATAWAGLAFLEALKDESMREQATAEIAHVYRYLSQRQSPEGGWGSRETEYKGARTITAYSTFIALRFLLRLHKTSTYVVDREGLQAQIRNGLNWILNGYVLEAKGWREYGSAGIQKDLATLYLIVLVEARQSGFEFVALRPAFQTAIANWIGVARNESADRQVIENSQLGQEQYRYAKSGELLRSNAPTASIVWHPSSLLLSSYLRDEISLTREQSEQVSSIYDQLFRRLPETVKAFSSGYTFMAAETLYTLGEMTAIAAESKRRLLGDR